MLRIPFLALGAVLLLAPLSGCDETGGTDGSIEERLDAARAARQSGDYDTAVQILETAFEAEPDNAPVRTEYAVTLLERDGINLLDLDRAASYLTDAAGGSAVPTSGSAGGGGGCALANDPDASEFDPTDYAGFPELEDNRAAIQQALALLDPIIPNALQNFDLCTGIVDGPDGPVFNYDRAAALAEMRAMGLTDGQISAALASNALSRFLNAFLFITLDIPQQQDMRFFRTNGGSGLGVCANDPDALLDQAEEAVADMGEAAYSIDLRAATFGESNTSRQLVELVTEGYEEIRDGIGDYCSN